MSNKSSSFTRSHIIFISVILGVVLGGGLGYIAEGSVLTGAALGVLLGALVGVLMSRRKTL